MIREDGVELIHYKDIREYGVYQPVCWANDPADDRESLWRDQKLVVLTAGVTNDEQGKSIPADREPGGLTKFFVREGSPWVLCAGDTDTIGYTGLLYRKLEHIEVFVGFRLKE